MKQLYLSKVVQIPNEKGEATIERVINRSKGINGRDDGYGRDINWYLDNNMKPPSYLFDETEEVEINEDGEILLNEHELDFDFLDYILPLKHYFSAEDSLSFGCIITDTQGEQHHVTQTTEEIYSYLEFINRPWYVVLRDDIKYTWSRIFHKKQKETNIDFEITD
jgi:hypothetical protein